jgi:prepilin-type N-terminal cleavage/methylation domain-containing protein/prepilin-type processing-associated H-X9-DG protein
MRAQGRFDRRAFTLLELLVVVAIIVLMLALLLPGLDSARETAKESVCGQTLRGMMVGIQGYIKENNDYFPPYAHVVYLDPPPVPSTRFAAILNNGKYTGPTMCPNYSEGLRSGSSSSWAPGDDAGAKQAIKRAEWKKEMGYAYNLQVGYLVQFPSRDYDYIFYDPDGDAEERLRPQLLRPKMYTDLKRPSGFALMGCGGLTPRSYTVVEDSTGVRRAYPAFQSLHGHYQGWSYPRIHGETDGPLHRGPRERGNVSFADGHVESLDEPQDYWRYESYYLWPGS